MKKEAVAAVLYTLLKFRAPAVLVMLLMSLAFVWPNIPGDKIASALADYAAKFPQEKVHLHLDRGYFAAGDTVNFKAYVVTADNNHLSDTSKILYIDLVDTLHKYAATFKYPIDGGIAWGTIELPDTLKAGNYALTAYTNWMKNFGEGLFYHANLQIGRLGENTATPQTAATTATPHTFFFPEGGNLVDQLLSVVGFKAVDRNGKGAAVSGSIEDETGKAITTFRSGFAGMGRFSLKPEPGHHYFALVKFNDGTEEKVALPAASPSGYVLTVDNSDKQEIRAAITYKGTGQPQPLLLVAQANHKLIKALDAKLVNNAAVVLFKRRDFPTAVTQITLFDAAGEPIAERLIFVNRHDQLQLKLSDAKTAGTAAHKMTLEVTDALLNPVKGEFSVAVVDQTRYTDSLKMPSIMADLLLTSDLKGNIESPDHYFEEGLPDAGLMLDNLMLTQGWRRFKWKDLLTGKYPQIQYPAEKLQTLGGSLVTANGKPVVNGKVLLVAKGDSAFTITTATNAQGRFVFDLPDVFEPRDFTMVGTTASGNNQVKIVPDKQGSFPPEKNALPGSYDMVNGRLKNYLATNAQYAGVGQLGASNTRQLKEVLIKAKQTTPKEKALAASGNLNGPGNADQVITYMELNKCNLLETCLEGKLTGVFFKTVVDKNSNEFKKIPYATGGMGKPMLIVLDGVPIYPPNELRLNNIPAHNVQTIEVLRSGAKSSIYGMDASGGAIVITTKQGGIDYDEVDEFGRKNESRATNYIALTYNAYRKSREFYTPPANAQKPQNTRQRETIFWKARLKSDENGKAAFEFTPANGVKKVSVVIEGLSEEGSTGYLYQQQNF